MSDLKLAVLFPGKGYGVKYPLLYYANAAFGAQGYETFPIDYQKLILDEAGSSEGCCVKTQRHA